MINTYIYGAAAVVLCYDITNAESFENLEDWYRKVKQSFGKGGKSGKGEKKGGKDSDGEGSDSDFPLCCLMGNKMDLGHLRAVKESRSAKFAVENNFLNYQVSAKSGDKVNLAFHQIGAALAKVMLPMSEQDRQTTIVTAGVTNYQRHDTSVEGGVVPEYTKPKGSCRIS